MVVICVILGGNVERGIGDGVPNGTTVNVTGGYAVVVVGVGVCDGRLLQPTSSINAPKNINNSHSN